MPYTNNSELPESVKSNLPPHAQDIFRNAFNSALESTCKDSDDTESCAMRVAWAAVKRKYRKDADGTWVENAEGYHEFSMHITKASFDKKTGKMKWAAVASDTGKDSYDEQMSVQLFEDFIRRINIEEPVPAEFRSSFYNGGMPYVSVSHYLDLDGKAAAGICDALYVDGDILKARGELFDNEVGRACWKAICRQVSDPSARELPIRISIAFLDWGHLHGSEPFTRQSLSDKCKLCEQGVGDKIYLEGQLVHLALTRVPANPRTEITLEERSMTTRKEDAASIIGEELAEKIDRESALVGKSEAMVIKSEETVVEASQVSTDVEVCAACGGKKKKTVKKMGLSDDPMSGPSEDNMMGEDEEGEPEDDGSVAILEKLDKIIMFMEQLTSKSKAEPAQHPLDAAILDLKATYDTVSMTERTAGEKLGTIQEKFNALGDAIRSNIEAMQKVSNPDPEPEMTQDVAMAVKSAMVEVLTPLVESIKQMTAVQKSQVVAEAVPVSTPRQEVPVRRSLMGNPYGATPSTVTTSTTPKLRSLIEKSIYGNSAG